MSAVPCLLAADEAADARLRAEVHMGLRATPRTLPATLFYDARGAALFEAICELPEYYPTRTEQAILATCAGSLARLIGPRAAIIEPGSGAATKVRQLLRQLRAPAAYLPVDVARGQLRRVAAELASEFPGLRVRPVLGDYRDHVHLPPLPEEARRVVFFPGSTIGNLHPHEAAGFLRDVAALVGPAGGLVLGVDRRKDTRLLHAAYNDAAGVTAEFNLNMLVRLNREFDGDFNVADFRHRAWFNEAESRIEMHLDSLTHQRVAVDGITLEFAPGESIRTEVSYKYDEARLDALAAASGWRVVTRFTDPADWFWVCWMEPLPSEPSTKDHA
jgi:dimethylhistidine N-methyltransferase